MSFKRTRQGTSPNNNKNVILGASSSLDDSSSILPPPKITATTTTFTTTINNNVSFLLEQGNNDDDDEKEQEQEQSQAQPQQSHQTDQQRKQLQQQQQQQQQHRNQQTDHHHHQQQTDQQQHPLITTLIKIDPILQFLTKATGETTIPLPMIYRTIPPALYTNCIISHHPDDNSTTKTKTTLSKIVASKSNDDESKTTTTAATRTTTTTTTESSSSSTTTTVPVEILFLQNINELVRYGILHYEIVVSNKVSTTTEATTTTTTTTTTTAAATTEPIVLLSPSRKSGSSSDDESNNFPMSWEDDTYRLGFPPPEVLRTHYQDPQQTKHQQLAQRNNNMYGSTKLAAKKRLSALKRYLASIEKEETKKQHVTKKQSTKATKQQQKVVAKQQTKQQQQQQQQYKQQQAPDIDTTVTILMNIRNNTTSICGNNDDNNDVGTMIITNSTTNEPILATPPRKKIRSIMNQQEEGQDVVVVNHESNNIDSVTTTCRNGTSHENNSNNGGNNVDMLCDDNFRKQKYQQQQPLLTKQIHNEDDAMDALYRILYFPFEPSRKEITSSKQQQGKVDNIGKLPSPAFVPNTNSNDNKISSKDTILNGILPNQVTYAGSFPCQPAQYGVLPTDIYKQIPFPLLRAFGIRNSGGNVPIVDIDNNDTASNESSKLLLFDHQVQAITAVMSGKHVSVCTGTGSGKSLCFLLPTLSAAYNDDTTSLLLYPTKALAQDQLSKLQTLVQMNPQLRDKIRPVTIDGDTAHSVRSVAADTGNIILTNPDTIHAGILPNWKNKHYTKLLSSIRYIIIDEAHLYDGIFGSHVAMILRRLVRCIITASCRRSSSSTGSDSTTTNTSTPRIPQFISTSATLVYPEQHFRQLFPVTIDPNIPVVIVSSEQDGSPRSAKHFFVWNPPILSMDGVPTGTVDCPEDDRTNSAVSSYRRRNSSTSIITPGSKRKRQQHNDPTSSSQKARLVTPIEKKDIPKKTTNGESDDEDVVNVPIEMFTGEQDDTMNYPTTRMGVHNDKNDDDTVNPHKFMKNRKNFMYETYSKYRRQHAAEETALLVTRAVLHGVRCIAFCKTRNVVEWVYSRTIETLKRLNQPDLANKVESYRGGYNMSERRNIEKRLFTNDVIAVIGTNALEVGIDIGGIDVTFHCGYPTSYTSLLQQAGRAGRGKRDCTTTASLSIVVCFNSPPEQQMWRRPTSILGHAITSPNTIPFMKSVVQGHLLCASDEFPLTGNIPLTAILGQTSIRSSDFGKVDAINGKEDPDQEVFVTDIALFGKEHYDTAVQNLLADKSLIEESIPVTVRDEYNDSTSTPSVPVYRAHTGLRKPSVSVSIRSIEPVNYSLVNLAHPGQAGRMDGTIYDANAVMDIIPYSRIFYQAHPGAIIQHRGRKYKIISMTRPPAYIAESIGNNYRRSCNLLAFAKPTTARYSTRPLSKLYITVVKQIESVELPEPLNVRVLNDTTNNDIVDTYDTMNSNKGGQESESKTIVTETGSQDPSSGNGTPKPVPVTSIPIMGSHTLVGCGAVNVKRSVHGYKKLSLINFTEISREELSLPPIEYETFGVYILLDLITLKPLLGETFGPGVHALSHAILAVAPLFAPGLVRGDVETDHATWEPTQIMLFDERAGGSGSVARLWDSFFDPSNNIIEAAIQLLWTCSFCKLDTDYDGGCPSCLHASNCLKFNTRLSRTAALVIGKRTLELIQRTDLYKKNLALSISPTERASKVDITPRRNARARALNNAKELIPASQRQFVIGRPSWPTDH